MVQKFVVGSTLVTGGLKPSIAFSNLKGSSESVRISFVESLGGDQPMHCIKYFLIGGAETMTRKDECVLPHESLVDAPGQAIFR